ncbi:proline dehydrogenase family protein [Acidipila rosea]|uniref:proline dehydrogenase n=1 Tax=Acidipila rosea TaxID=768535 RepID=A0A4R1L3Y4_9BACT|nr:proline dehydrogenase family protein [Acidipila rosea]MBW4027474.1 proline dehydrogenase [Acidobacteriota bacterium]MBW4045653.1 proline dehydrogenase [Acidobacteriota bacterium]TCK71740.1 L-proline dehydrogenase [Acidipila rosea]
MPVLRSAFIALSRNAGLRRFSERSSLGRRMSSRFVAGMEPAEVIAACEALNRQGIAATLDSLGENVTTPAEAQTSAAIYHRLLDEIERRKLNANVSVKLTQMGMDLGSGLAEEIVAGLVDHAIAANSFVRVDMEGTEYTDATIELVRRIHARPGSRGHVGIVIQAYLYRSEQDIQTLLGDGIRIRLCKGAYKEPPDKAFPAKADVDANFVKLAGLLLRSGIYHGIATHDEKMISATRQFVREHGIDPASFEFQMLYGVRRDLQTALVKEGFGMRVYVPFGHEWYPYFMRRLAERPANVLFIARNMLRK